MTNNRKDPPFWDGEASLIETFQSRRQVFLEAYLLSAGMADLELRAQWELIPEPICRVLPSPQNGFGLIGGYQVGKTSALAAMLRREAEQTIDRIMARMIECPEEDFLLREAIRVGRLPAKPRLSWVSWPTEVAAQRAKLFLRDVQGEPEVWIQEKLLNGNVTLILDDIGVDRATIQDWSGETLGRVIDERLRWGRRTFWTSNSDPVVLAERYTGWTFSRLQQLAPAVVLPSLPAFSHRPA